MNLFDATALFLLSCQSISFDSKALHTVHDMAPTLKVLQHTRPEAYDAHMVKKYVDSA